MITILCKRGMTLNGAMELKNHLIVVYIILWTFCKCHMTSESISMESLKIYLY